MTLDPFGELRAALGRVHGQHRLYRVGSIVPTFGMCSNR
jgi:hypothetical protein